jgi:tetratricopeptide (TPR) repeat protein
VAHKDRQNAATVAHSDIGLRRQTSGDIEMDQQATAFYELRFKTQFLESKGSAFQNLFVDVMAKAHPADFMPCRPWGRVGDRKNDGYLKSERTLFQVYAPNEMRMADAVSKIVMDFTEALPHWQEYFDTWVFVHNAYGGLPPDVIAKLLELERLHSPIKLTHWGFDELLLRFRLLPPEALYSLYGYTPTAEPKKESDARRKLKHAQELARERKHSEAIREMTEALSLAREEKREEEEVEILVALAILSSDRRGRGDRQHYFQQAEKKANKLKSSAARAIYFRARAAVLEEQRDFAGAEEAFKDALGCCAEPEDEKGNLAIQGCVVRSSFVHFLCNEKRLEDARPILAECEEYARQNRDIEEGELLHAALGAGIHFALEAGDEDGAILRLTELEESASTVGLADRIGSDIIDVANRASHRNAHRTALAAAQASIRLARRASESAPGFLAGTLYTEAVVIMKAGDHETALKKAEALLDMCHSPEDTVIKHATQHLIAEIRRCSGDSQTAVDLARLALSASKGRPEETAFTKCALARALNDNGQTEEALKQAQEAWILTGPTELPAHASAEILSQITNYASQLGAEDDLAEAMSALDQLPDDSDEVKRDKKRAGARAFANGQLRQRLLGVLKAQEPKTLAATGACTSLSEANALVVRPLLRLWDDLREAGLECIGGAYDFWGRGNFERMLLNTRSFPNCFNVTLEVRSLDDVKRAIRIWGLYSDFLMLIWKGPTENGLAIIPFPDDYEQPGGWGYTIAAGSTINAKPSKKTWYPAVGRISIFPDDVAIFLATEARPFIKSGRLVVVPAVGAGCINPGHGPFEQLLAEAANAIPSVRWRGVHGTPIGYVPHSPNAPFEVLAEVAETEAARLRKLRLLLLKRSQQLRPDAEIGVEAKVLALEIEDALREMEDRNDALARTRGLEKANEPLIGATARFKSSGRKLAGIGVDSPFAPLLVLQSLGYGWRVDGPEIPRFPSRFEPQENDVIGTWLAPPSAGWTIPTAVVATQEGD